jgi:hypothetical protein
VLIQHLRFIVARFGHPGKVNSEIEVTVEWIAGDRPALEKLHELIEVIVRESVKGQGNTRMCEQGRNGDRK